MYDNHLFAMKYVQDDAYYYDIRICYANYYCSEPGVVLYTNNRIKNQAYSQIKIFSGGTIDKVGLHTSIYCIFLSEIN